MQGIEIGSGGLAVRGVVPLMDTRNHSFGSVEVLLDFSVVLPTPDEADTAELIYIKDSYLSVATALQDPLKNSRTGNFVLAAATSNDRSGQTEQGGTAWAKTVEFVEPDLLQSALEGQAVRKRDSLYFIASPFTDFSGSVAGVIVCIMRTNRFLTPILESLSILLAMLVSGTLIFFLLSQFTLHRLVTRPINDVAAQIDAIVEEKSDLAKPIFYSARDEIGNMVSKYNALAAKINIIFEEMIRTQTVLRDARNLAEEHAKAKSLFLANMSHEIRTPMNAVIGMTSIARAAKEPQRKDYCLEKIDEASKHLLGVINDILDMSKIDAGKLELAPETFSFSNMLSRVLTVITFRVEEKKQHFSVVIDETIPDVLVADEQRLAQILANLLSNAVKFTPNAGSVALRADRLVSTDDSQCVLRISVKDSGIGMSAEQQKRLFQPFQQADSGISRKYGGTGLGLALSRRLIEMMHGRIWLTSEQGVGSTFFLEVTLPVGDRANLSGANDNIAQFRLEAVGIFKDKRLLLVEDVDINQEIILAILERTEATIECAANGVEAVKKFRACNGNYDLILMDIQMPEMDGYDATRQLRVSGIPGAEKIPIIAMTANVFREDIEKCLAAGMNGHLGKPVDEAELFRVLRAYLA